MVDAAHGRIEDYALLSDLRTAALVGLDGSVDWLCLPRFDAQSCFARLLGDEKHGHWRIAPTGDITEVRRRYRGDTLVLETEFHTPEGVVRLIDTMPPHPADTGRKNRQVTRFGGPDEPRLVRVIEGVSGRVEVAMRWVIRFAYADAVPWVRRHAERGDDYITAIAGPQTVVLRGDPLPEPLDGEQAHEVIVTLGKGDRFSWTMQWQSNPDQLPARLDPAREIENSVAFWRGWPGGLNYSGPRAAELRRSLVTLKALTYAPTGGIVAAPTTSLPEELGGERNWDYRYCWLRDAALTILAFDNFGVTDEAAAWRMWLLRAVAGDPADVQIMYGINGERHLVEWEVDWLPGYQGSRPVRVGNAAFRQLQLDVYGEVMDALHLSRVVGLPESDTSWELQRGLMEHLEQIWQKPDKGIWEVRGPDRHFTHSRIMVWVAFDRAVRAVEEFGLPGPAQRWRTLRDTIHQEVLDQGWNAEIGSFTQYYGGTELDAATLLMPAFGFLPGDDARVRSTIEVIGRTLKRGDLVDRYSTQSGQSAVDGLTGREGSFLACSFWYADALALSGRRDEAVAMFDRLVGLSNDVGLLAEEYDAEAGRFTGNFPQAFSHLAMANSAAILFGDKTTHRHHRKGEHPHRHRFWHKTGHGKSTGNPA